MMIALCVLLLCQGIVPTLQSLCMCLQSAQHSPQRGPTTEEGCG